MYIKKYKCARNGKYLANIDSVDFEEGCLRILQYPVLQSIYTSDDHSIERVRLGFAICISTVVVNYIDLQI